MNDGTEYVVLLIVVLVIAILGYAIYSTKYNQPQKDTPESYLADGNISARDALELFDQDSGKRGVSTSIKIYNTLGVEMGVYYAPYQNLGDYGETRFIARIPPHGYIDVKGRVFKKGNVLRFSTFEPEEEKLYDYAITGSLRSNKLYVGMLSLRYIGSARDRNRMITTTASNAVSGQPWVRVHNLSYQTLSFNDGRIKVAPHSVFDFKGYTHTGVPLGQIFKDDSGKYETYIYTKPYSDLFYGVVSDTPQLDEGCWQLEFNDRCGKTYRANGETGQTMWPMEEGIY